MEIIYKNIKDIKEYDNNPRKNDEAVEYVANSIKEFGFNEDICIIENKYIVTKTGKVFTIYKNKIKEQKLRKHTNGYLRATIFNKDFYVHRLVAICFLDNPNNYNEISHEDNDKTNNNLSNLKWCDRKYNNKKMFTDHIKTSEDMKKIANCSNAVEARRKRRILKDENVTVIREMINQGKSDRQISKIFNCSRGTIYQIRKWISYAK